MSDIENTRASVPSYDVNRKLAAIVCVCASTRNECEVYVLSSLTDTVLEVKRPLQGRVIMMMM